VSWIDLAMLIHYEQPSIVNGDVDLWERGAAPENPIAPMRVAADEGTRARPWPEATEMASSPKRRPASSKAPGIVTTGQSRGDLVSRRCRRGEGVSRTDRDRKCRVLAS
jgi:hypothetical protein